MTRSTFSRRTAVKAGAALAALPIAGAAAPVSRSTATSSRAQDLPGAELEFFFGGNPEEAKTRQKIIDAFMAKYPQIKINARIAESDPVQELQVQFAGDVAHARGPVATLAEEGAGRVVDLLLAGVGNRNCHITQPEPVRTNTC